MQTAALMNRPLEGPRSLLELWPARRPRLDGPRAGAALHPRQRQEQGTEDCHATGVRLPLRSAESLKLKGHHHPH